MPAVTVVEFEADSEDLSFADRAYLAVRDRLIMLNIRPNAANVEKRKVAVRVNHASRACGMRRVISMVSTPLERSARARGTACWG